MREHLCDKIVVFVHQHFLERCSCVLLFSSIPLFAASNCLPICEASQHVGKNKCVTGKVLRVKAEPRAFTSGTSVKIKQLARLRGGLPSWSVKLYNGRAEITRNSVSQLKLTGGSTFDFSPAPYAFGRFLRSGIQIKDVYEIGRAHV